MGLLIKHFSRTVKVRWRFKLYMYDLNIEHRDGNENVIADVLTRNPKEDISN